MSKLLNSNRFAGRSNPTADESFNPNHPPETCQHGVLTTRHCPDCCIPSPDAPQCSASGDSAPVTGNRTPDPIAGALPVGTRVMMHSRDNTRVWRGYVMPSVTSTPPDCRRVFWDDDWVSTAPISRLDEVS